MDLKEVCHVSGFKKTTIYKWMKDGKFPSPIKLGRSVRWSSSDIEEWIVHKLKRDV
ncbi:helix-turn-helix transcriptional regulator [Atlantibacter hermannii]|uniref:helix-turn-helix transcriptional regulator n=1 Tax=Atlantibacter hermannii TaxID=565 RepID=UPI0028A94794|nr:AlpA family phage regulatory protein [Atlantibacter hermannii]MCQ4969197.1 AlpA family phage regulatory protein [Enterobacteriaceae bacterium DFI.7.85]